MKKSFDVFGITHLVFELVENYPNFVRMFYNNALDIIVRLTTYVKETFIDITSKILDITLDIPFWTFHGHHQRNYHHVLDHVD